MSKSKIFAMMASIAFAMGILLVSNTLAGEIIKGRTVYVSTKWEQINVGDEKDHVVAVGELKGVSTIIRGKPFGDGWLSWCKFVWDFSPTAGANSNGYGTWADRDGDTIFWKFDRKASGVVEWSFYKGTGKFQGIQGKGTANWVLTAEPTLTYSDWELEVEFPR